MAYKKKEDKKSHDKKYYQIPENRKRKQETNRELYRNKIDKIKKYHSSPKYRANENLRLSKKYRENSKFNLTVKVRILISKSLRDNKNGKHWEDLVGYTLKDLIKRFKKTMPKGYNWNDYTKGELHIDHIIPISAFHFSKSEHPDFKKCWALKNLRLLLAKENLMKGSKLTIPFQPALKISFIS